MLLNMQDWMDIQNTLQEKYRGVWEGNSPETAQHHLLYAVEEIGEVSAIMKKRSPAAIVKDASVRAHFCEEMADVFMYLTDVLLCCGVTAEEFDAAYRAKAARNLRRDFTGEHSHYLTQDQPRR